MGGGTYCNIKLRKWDEVSRERGVTSRKESGVNFRGGGAGAVTSS